MSIKDQLSNIAKHFRQRLSSKTPELFINQIAPETNDSLAIVTDDTFEVCLDSAEGGQFYIAEKILKRSKDGNRFDDVTISIVNSVGQLYKFKSPTSFLDFMNERGYEMVTEEYDSFCIYYTFKRKQV